MRVLITHISQRTNSGDVTVGYQAYTQKGVLYSLITAVQADSSNVPPLPSPPMSIQSYDGGDYDGEDNAPLLDVASAANDDRSSSSSSSSSSKEPNGRSRCAQSTRVVAVAVTVVGMIGSWIAMGELVQGSLLKEYNHPFFILFATRLGYSIWLAGWLVWRLVAYGCNQRRGGLHQHTQHTQRTPRMPEDAFSWKYYTLLALAMSTMSIVGGYSWYISLEHTTVAGNTALYVRVPIM